jgi:acyl carrier protein
MTRGYLNHPGLTAEKFIPDPFSAEPGGRLYKTGDLARYLPDGKIECLGRIDYQVKIRGYRIECGEIEAAIRQCPGVQESVVVARQEILGASSLSIESGRRLMAYVVPEQGSAPSAHELRSFLTQKLPEYMLPSVFVFLDSLPLTPNGKLDRAALPAPDRSRPDLANLFVSPRTLVEDSLARIWLDVLKLDKVSIHDNFFELGGHSLLATQVVSRVRDVFQMELPLRTLFDKRTVYDLAKEIAKLAGESVRSDSHQIESFADKEAQSAVKKKAAGGKGTAG